MSSNNGVTITAGGTFSASDSLDVTVTITVDSNDVGNPGRIVVLASLNGTWYMREGADWKPWNGVIADLAPAETIASLAETETVNVVTGLSGLPGEYKVFVGYQNEAGVTSYTKNPITFTVQ